MPDAIKHPAVVVRLFECWSVLADLTRTPDRVFGCSSQYHLDIGMARHDPIPESVAASGRCCINEGDVNLGLRHFQSGPRLLGVLSFDDPVPALPQILGQRITNVIVSLNQEDNGRSGRHGTLLFSGKGTGLNA